MKIWYASLSKRTDDCKILWNFVIEGFQWFLPDSVLKSGASNILSTVFIIYICIRYAHMYKSFSPSDTFIFSQFGYDKFHHQMCPYSTYVNWWHLIVNNLFCSFRFCITEYGLEEGFKIWIFKYVQQTHIYPSV